MGAGILQERASGILKVSIACVSCSSVSLNPELC